MLRHGRKHGKLSIQTPYSEDIGAIAVELNGEWIEVPSVFEKFQGECAQTWMLAVREVRASVAAQKTVDQVVIFKSMTRIKDDQRQRHGASRLGGR